MQTTCLHKVFLTLALGIHMVAQSQTTAPQLGKDPVSAVVQAMTLEEKAHLVVGKGFSIGSFSMGSTDDTPDKITGISGHTVPIPRLGIPSLGFADGPAGVHRLTMTAKDSADHAFTTAWPVGTLLASSWDTALVQRLGVAFGEEIKDYGIDFILGPGANIHRNPLGGRNFEYYSEDPLLSGKTAAAIINGIQSQGVGATIKHFAANNQETDRMTVNTIVSERALREIYLKNFEIAIKDSKPWAIMTSYNYINGTYTSESADLVTSILRDEWKYKGYVMTDWFGGKDPVAQMKAGNNLLMPGTSSQVKAIVDAVKAGTLPVAVLDKNVEGILTVMLQTPTFKKYAYPNHSDLAKHAQVSREVAAESMVLLKNNNHTLPIQSTVKKIALFGNYAFNLIAGGTGSGDVSKPYAISLADGLLKAGYSLDKELQQHYMDYVNDYNTKHPKKPLMQEFMDPTPPAAEYAVEAVTILQKAAAADMAIIYIGRNAGEGTDRKVANDYELTMVEKELLKTTTDAFHAQHKPVVAVLNIGGVIDLSAIVDQVDAVLLAWQPGEEGGNAMTDVLSGKVNPSGKLATTFPMKYEDMPSARNFPGKEFPEQAVNSMMGKLIPAEVRYEEGVYNGYRYFNSFNIKPAFEFGYGLSYTSFSYSPVTLSAGVFAGSLTATVTITNTGKVAGKEVVQLYLSAPAKKLDKPAAELKGFAKTGLLQPGQSQTIRFTLKPEDLASFYTDISSWMAEAGMYTVKIGASSVNIQSSASFSVPKEMIVEKVHKAMVPQVAITDMQHATK